MAFFEMAHSLLIVAREGIQITAHRDKVSLTLS